MTFQLQSSWARIALLLAILLVRGTAADTPAPENEVPLIGTRWAISDDDGLHYGIRFLTDKTAEIDAPDQIVLKANWARTGNQIAFAVKGGFENRVGTVSGKQMTGVSRMGVHPTSGPSGSPSWRGSLVDEFSNPQPILYCGSPPSLDRKDRNVTDAATITLAFKVLSTGRITNLRVVGEAPPEYRDAAFKQATRWRFIPRMVDGRAVDASVEIPIRFSFFRWEDRIGAGSPKTQNATDENAGPAAMPVRP